MEMVYDIALKSIMILEFDNTLHIIYILVKVYKKLYNLNGGAVLWSF